ncbi:dehydrogenase, partial [Burkholderia pseudomallei]
GYTLIQVRSRDGSLAWSRGLAAPFGEHDGGGIDVRQLLDPDDFEPGGGVDRLLELQS